MENIYSHAFPDSRDIKELIGRKINDFDFFLVSTPGNSIIINATNDKNEIFYFETFRAAYTHVLRKSSDGSLAEISKRDIAKEKFRSLTEEQQFELIQEIVIDKMLEES